MCKLATQLDVIIKTNWGTYTIEVFPGSDPIEEYDNFMKS